MDTAQRQLERAATDGDIDAEARALRARVRAFPTGWGRADVGCETCPGNGSDGMGPCPDCHGTGKAQWPVQSRMELAAYAGSAAARRLLDWKPCDDPHNHKGPYLPILGVARDFGRCLRHCDAWPLDLWIEGLARWPKAVSVRAACAAAARALPVWHEEQECPEGYGHGWYVNHPYPGSDEYEAPSAAIKAARHWCDVQTEEAREACYHAMLACGGDDRGPFWGLVDMISHDHPAAPESNPIDVIRGFARLTSPKAVREAICIELINYSLGEI